MTATPSNARAIIPSLIGITGSPGSYQARIRKKARRVDEDACIACNACMEVCPTGARVFGDLKDPEGPIQRILKEKRIYILKEDVGTLPRFYYFFDK